MSNDGSVSAAGNPGKEPNPLDSTGLDSSRTNSFSDSAKSLIEGIRNGVSKMSDSRVAQSYQRLGDSVESVNHRIHQRADSLIGIFYGAVIRSPGSVVVLLLLSTALIGRDAMDFQHQINGDVEIYLPDGANSTDLLLEVREQWSTDIVLLYVH